MIKTDSLVLLIYLLIIGLFYVVSNFGSMASNDKIIKMWKEAVVT